MANLGNGNGWRQRDEAWDPVERGDVSVEPGISSEDPPGFAGDSQQGYAFDYPKTAWRHALCKGCYCTHNPACPPCECDFHNPNVP